MGPHIIVHHHLRGVVDSALDRGELVNISVSKDRVHQHSQHVVATAVAHHGGGGETQIVVGAPRIQKTDDGTGLAYGMVTAQ